MFDKLFERYNMANHVGLYSRITLPHSGASVKIVTNDFEWCVQSLLTDPSIQDKDYLFHDDNPFQPPPPNLDVVGDINTSQVYCNAYRKYITNPAKQVLLPVIFYIDATATMQFTDLEVTALKFTFGIFNRKARDRPQMWRIMGYVPKVVKEKAHGRRQFLNSGHVESVHLGLSMAEEEGIEGVDAEDSEHKAQDLHSILAKILEPYRKMQDCGGFVWDLSYGGKYLQEIEFIPYVHMIKCDTDEADKLCGAYTSRSGKVSQLCRCCLCPNDESDNPAARIIRKTMPMIQDMIDKNDLEELQNVSQHPITNAFYPLRFGVPDEESIHGSCPFEMLHHLLLGIFKYVRDCFLEHTGKDTEAAKALFAIADQYGEQFTRQSYREMPVTKFSSGIQHKGKMTGKKYSGLLLVLAATLRSTMGSHLFGGLQKCQNKADHAKNWVRMLEILLMWEMWLKSEEISKDHIRKAKRRHQHIMWLLRIVANRQAGLQWKIVKFHAILHMADDIIRFGVPMCFDTGSDESGHKPTKTAALVTQKRKDKFDQQVCLRLNEVHALRLAHEEITTGRDLWQYKWWAEDDNDSDEEETPGEDGIRGTTFAMHEAADGTKSMRVIGRRLVGMSSNNVPIEESFCEFVGTLADLVLPYGVHLVVQSTMVLNNARYRGTPWYDGAIWRDWAMVNWGHHGTLPNKIWGFVDLSALPPNNAVVWGGQNPIEPGVYGIVESADPVSTRNADRSEDVV